MVYEVRLISDFIPPLSTRVVYVEADDGDAAHAIAGAENEGWITTNAMRMVRVVSCDPNYVYGRQMRVEFEGGGTRRIAYDEDLIALLHPRS